MLTLQQTHNVHCSSIEEHSLNQCQPFYVVFRDLSSIIVIVSFLSNVNNGINSFIISASRKEIIKCRQH